MFLRRLVYALLLLAALAAFIMTDSGIALFVCVCLVVLPLCSFFMLLAVKNKVKLDWEIQRSCIRGNPLKITMRVGVQPRFMAGYAVVAADVENSTFGKTVRKTFIFTDLTHSPHDYYYDSADSGRVCIRIPYVRIVDIFGIFALRVKTGKYEETSVSPILYEQLQLRLGSNARSLLSGETALNERGNDHTEIFNIRDYSAGDSLNSVHWKLSSKFDSLKTKEFGSTDDNKMLILVDMSRNKWESVATDEQLNSVLDVAISISDSFKTGGIAHSIGWFNDGAFGCAEVTDNNTFVEAVTSLMSIKVNDGNAETMFYLSRLGRLAYTKIILVTTSVQSDELKSFGGADITVVAVGDDTGDIDELGTKIICIPYRNVRTSLAASVL